MNTPIPGSLFDEDGGQPGSLVLTLAQSGPASEEQRQFQRLVAQIELRRDQLQSWQAYLLRYNQRISSELVPLQTQLRTEQQQMVALIDELLTRPGQWRRLKRVQRAKLRALLLDLLEGLLEEERDAALEALHDRYSDVPHEQVRQSDMQLTQAFIEEVTGLHIDEEHGASGTEELLQYARRKLQERADANQVQGGPYPGATHSGTGGANDQANQALREEAAREVRQSLREVFRKLVSALHPDREPDEQVRQRKTLLMQRVNQAYEARDLLTLLTLQLEIEQFSTASLSAASRERLTHYNQILREQLVELDLELEHCIAPFRQRLDNFWGRSLTIADVEHGLSATCAQLAVVIRELQADMVAFRDPERLHESLERFELESEPDAPDGLAESVTTLPLTSRRPGRRRS